MGMATVFSILGEVVGYSLAQRMQGRIGSRRMIILAFAFRTLWFILIAFNQSPLLILPIHIISGSSFP